MIKRLDLKLEVKPDGAMTAAAMGATAAAGAAATGASARATGAGFLSTIAQDSVDWRGSPAAALAATEKVVGRPPFFAEVLEAI